MIRVGVPIVIAAMFLILDDGRSWKSAPRFPAFAQAGESTRVVTERVGPNVGR